MVNKKQENEMNDAIKSIKDKIYLSKKIANSNEDNRKILEMKESIRKFRESIRELSDIENKYCKKHIEITENLDENSNKLFESYWVEFSNAFNKAKEISENIEKKTSNCFGSGIKFSDDDNFIINLINEYKEYLSNLSITEICLVINISSSLFILACLVSILLGVYGNFLLNKLSLEEKYPKIAKLVKLRVKLQHTYILVNTLLILVVLILMIIINFITLTNG